MQLIAGFATKFGDAPWATGILERVASARLGLQVGASVLESSPEAAPPDEHVVQALKLLKPFLGPLWGKLTALARKALFRMPERRHGRCIMMQITREHIFHLKRWPFI